jgi:SAM-dependent methyltransferase
VLHVGEGGPPACTLAEANGELKLTVGAKARTFELTLPSGDGAGTIAISGADGEAILPRRVLPSGVLPHGEAGAKLLARWDAAYRDGRRPGWDVGRPATELKKTVEAGTIKPGRAVVLGCGTGTNAIYLAEKGFDVTAIDIAPTALARAKAKADKAGVTVRWVLADVLAVPELEPFDFIFDRGCYHGVRRHDAKGYVKTLERLSHGGTRALILAGNANEERHYGPPRVKEEELRGDFTELFDFEHLNEIRFDGRDSTGKGPLAWSILLRRKGEPQCDAGSGPCITDPTRQPVVIEADKIPRFGANSPFDDDYEAPKVKKERRLWATSWLWAKAPEFVVEEWITDKPDMKGKYVLIEYWATWCPPCRRSLSLLNELHRKFGKELVVIGISEEPAAAVLQLNEKHPDAAKIEFYCAVDTQKRMKDKLGVFGIPHVILLEPDGYVIWEGFPLQEGFELTGDIIERVLAIGRKLRAKEKTE